MEREITLSIPADWLGNQVLSQDDLRQALRLGLQLLRPQNTQRDTTAQVVQALLTTGRVRHLTGVRVDDIPPRQTPPTLPGMPVSEIIVAQRRGEL
jgi:hypothetical protein